MDYTVEPYPSLRKMLSDAWAVTKSEHTFVALVEMDITRVRNQMRLYEQKTQEKLSLTAYVGWCVAQAVDAHKEVCAMRTWNGKVITYHDVDINVLIEKQIGNQLLGLVHVIRAANNKEFIEVHRDIRKAQTSTPQEVAGIKGREKWMNLLLAIPGFIRRLLWRVLLANPHFIKKLMGTVSISAVGMAGQGGGWGIPGKALTFAVVIGGICERNMLNNDGSIARHEFLQLTFLFNHEVVDGAPAARFLKDLKQLLESGNAVEALLK